MLGDILIAGMLIMAGFFGLVGSFGLLRLPDPMTRLHAPTKASTLGVGGALLASILFSILHEDSVTWHELLITLFIFLTAPITANFLAKAHIHRTLHRGDLPPTGTDADWATQDTTEDAAAQSARRGES